MERCRRFTPLVLLCSIGLALAPIADTAGARTARGGQCVIDVSEPFDPKMSFSCLRSGGLMGDRPYVTGAIVITPAGEHNATVISDRTNRTLEVTYDVGTVAGPDATALLFIRYGDCLGVIGPAQHCAVHVGFAGG